MGFIFRATNTILFVATFPLLAYTQPAPTKKEVYVLHSSRGANHGVKIPLISISSFFIIDSKSILRSENGLEIRSDRAYKDVFGTPVHEKKPIPDVIFIKVNDSEKVSMKTVSQIVNKIIEITPDTLPRYIIIEIEN